MPEPTPPRADGVAVRTRLVTGPPSPPCASGLSLQLPCHRRAWSR